MIDSGYKVYDVMTIHPVSVSKDATVQQAAKVMHENKVGSILIMDKKKVEGILNEGTIVAEIAGNDQKASKIKVDQLMTTKLITIDPQEDIQKAIKRMRDRNIKHLPVINEDGSLAGLLTMKDIIRIQPQLIEEVLESIHIREISRKPIDLAEKEGVCNNCGEYSDSLREYEGSQICINCQNMLE